MEPLRVDFQFMLFGLRLTIHNIIRVGIVGQLGHFDTPEDIVRFPVNKEEVISSVTYI